MIVCNLYHCENKTHNNNKKKDCPHAGGSDDWKN